MNNNIKQIIIIVPCNIWDQHMKFDQISEKLENTTNYKIKISDPYYVRDGAIF
jgi:hypothetical protein